MDAHAPKEIKALARKLADQLKVEVKITNERSGYHIYIPCPECAKTHKRRELQDPKYAINASKATRTGIYKDIDAPLGSPRRRLSEQAEQNCGVCMRTHQHAHKHMFTLRQLLEMNPLRDTIPELSSSDGAVVMAARGDKEQYWIEDPATGTLCPPPPGTVIPITMLPLDHPAVVYLTQRGYNLHKLYNQFRCSYCTEEFPSGSEHNVWYRRMPGGWKDTFQGRIIFYSMVDGAPLTFQGRYIEYTSDDKCMRYALNPYSNAWDLIETRSNPDHSWIRSEPFDQTKPETGTLLWDPAKYKTASNSFRELMGWDSAISNIPGTQDSVGFSYCVLCEGPLDAARVGPGGIAMIGKSVSTDNATKLVENFQVIITALDRDGAGRKASEKIQEQLGLSRSRKKKLIAVVQLQIPDTVKDIGEMSQDAFDALLSRTLRKQARVIGM